jgi:hypothetical protein
VGTEENRLLVRRFYEDVVNTGNVEGIADLVAADCVETDGKMRVVSGIAGTGEPRRGRARGLPEPAFDRRASDCRRARGSSRVSHLRHE